MVEALVVIVAHLWVFHPSLMYLVQLLTRC
jgi:hypothetical protein